MAPWQKPREQRGGREEVQGAVGGLWSPVRWLVSPSLCNSGSCGEKSFTSSIICILTTCLLLFSWFFAATTALSHQGRKIQFGPCQISSHSYPCSCHWAVDWGQKASFVHLLPNTAEKSRDRDNHCCSPQLSLCRMLSKTMPCDCSSLGFILFLSANKRSIYDRYGKEGLTGNNTGRGQCFQAETSGPWLQFIWFLELYI